MRPTDHFFLFARREEKPIGVASLQLEQKNLLRGRLRRLYVLGDISGVLRNSFADFLFAKAEFSPICLDAFKNYLHGKGRVLWDYLELENLSLPSPSWTALTRAEGVAAFGESAHSDRV